MPGLTGIIKTNGGILRDDDITYADMLLHDVRYEIKTIVVDKVRTVDCIVINDMVASNFGVFKTDRLIVCYQGEILNKDYRSNVGDINIAKKIASEYLKDGMDFVKRLNGSFIIYIYDEKLKKDILINDHHASRPIYYFINDDEIMFSPEIKNIIRRFGLELNEVAVTNFIINGHLIGDETYLKQAKALAPATILEISSEGIFFKTYWNHCLNTADIEDEGNKSYMKKLSNILLEVIDERMYSINDVVVPISGGVDSRGILACVREISDKKINTVSWGVNENDKLADAYIGRKVSEKLGMNHHFLRREKGQYDQDVRGMSYIIDAMTDDPVLHSNELNIIRKINSSLGSSLLMRGEECFGLRQKVMSFVEANALMGLYKPTDFKNLGKILHKNLVQYIEDNESEQLESLMTCLNKKQSFNDYKDSLYFYQRVFNYNNKSTYYKLSVLDVQSPWLDRRILDFYQNIPEKYRYDKILYTNTLSQMFPDLMSVPLAQKHSLEVWSSEIVNNENVYNFVRDNVENIHHTLNGVIDESELNLMFESLSGVDDVLKEVGFKGHLINSIKRVINRYPRLYGMMKSAVLKNMRVRELEIDKTLLRFSTINNWLRQLNV